MASKRSVRRRACSRKQQYATQAEAWGHMMRLRRLTGNADYHSYRCAWGHWHVGRPNRSTLARKEVGR